VKLKRPSCSTGHATGVTPDVDLGTVLARDRHRLKMKQLGRMTRMLMKELRHGRPQGEGGSITEISTSFVE
jgi:hypothetical protein